jgi:hypothetical protein
MSAPSTACFSNQPPPSVQPGGALGRSVLHLRSRTAPILLLMTSPHRQTVSPCLILSAIPFRDGHLPRPYCPLQKVPTRCWNERENTPTPGSTPSGMRPRGHSTRRPPTGMLTPDISGIPLKTPSTWQAGTLRQPDGATSLVPCCRACLTCGLPTSLPRNREI